MTTARFRLLVIGWIGIDIWLFSLPLGAYKESEAVREALRHAGRGAVIPTSTSLAFALLTVSFIAAVGLLAFQNWARHLFLALTLANIVLLPLHGVAVAGPFANTLGLLLVLLNGALLVLSYVSPMAAAFRTGHAAEPEKPEPRHEAEEELIAVFETNSAATVPVIASLLESCGIHCVTVGEPLQDIIAGGRLGGSNPVVGPVRFLVSVSQAEAARMILDARIAEATDNAI